MDTADFLRLYPIRSPNIQWFFGAGAFAAAGISTAFHMIWDFKRTLYCAAPELRHALIESCKRYGLAVVGYSGRDQSVMDALETAIDGGRGFPSGLFWFHRSESSCSPRITDPIEKSTPEGIDAHLVHSDTSDGPECE